MARQLVCDVCKKPTDAIVAKLYLSQRTNGKHDHANYTAHADVGSCCLPRLAKDVKWTRRKKINRGNRPDNGDTPFSTPEMQEIGTGKIVVGDT